MGPVVAVYDGSRGAETCVRRAVASSVPTVVVGPPGTRRALGGLAASVAHWETVRAVTLDGVLDVARRHGSVWLTVPSTFLPSEDLLDGVLRHCTAAGQGLHLHVVRPAGERSVPAAQYDRLVVVPGPGAPLDHDTVPEAVAVHTHASSATPEVRVVPLRGTSVAQALDQVERLSPDLVVVTVEVPPHAQVGLAGTACGHLAASLLSWLAVDVVLALEPARQRADGADGAPGKHGVGVVDIKGARGVLRSDAPGPGSVLAVSEVRGEGR